MTITQITDHEDRAAARIVGKLRDKPRFEALVRALVSPFQEIEDTLWALFESDVDSATGDELDVLGRIVGEPRAGETDDEVYRRRVRARIMANRSNGTVEDLIRVSRLIVNDDAAYHKAVRQSVATIVLRIEDVAITQSTADVLIAMLSRAVAAGVRIILESMRSAPASVFRFDSGPGLDQGNFADAQEGST